MKDDEILVKITNEGARVGLLMFMNSLIGLMSFHNQKPKIKTIDEYRDDLVENIEKAIGWTNREDDETVDAKELKKITKEAKETLKWVKKAWKK